MFPETTQSQGGNSMHFGTKQVRVILKVMNVDVLEKQVSLNWDFLNLQGVQEMVTDGDNVRRAAAA